MANRKPIREALDPFRMDIDQPAPMTQHAEDIFEEARRKEDKRQLARPLPITNIYPDPAQPRRAIPYTVRAHWDGQIETLPQVFEDWRALVEDERGAPLSLRARIMTEGEHAETEAADYGPLESSLMALAELAANIRRHGLMNPITVVRIDGRYQIETGERRWLAHHLLYNLTGDENWRIVSARVVDQVSVWRQAGENSARTNLNAISKARQFALLLMDLHRENATFGSFDDLAPVGASDRLYYAQVADSERFRIPKGQGERMLNAMGLKGRATFSRYRAMLQLPDVIWQLGDDYNWSDDRLYLLATMSPDEALARAQQMKRRDDTRRTDQSVLTQNNSEAIQTPAAWAQTALETSDFKRRTLRVARMVDRIGRLNDSKRHEGVDEINAIRRWLDEAERVLTQPSSH